MNDNSKILVCKNSDNIIISQDGKKLIIYNKDILFSKLKDLSKTEIIKWYLNR